MFCLSEKHRKHVAFWHVHKIHHWENLAFRENAGVENLPNTEIPALLGTWQLHASALIPSSKCHSGLAPTLAITVLIHQRHYATFPGGKPPMKIRQAEAYRTRELHLKDSNNSHDTYHLFKDTRETGTVLSVLHILLGPTHGLWMTK